MKYIAIINSDEPLTEGMIQDIKNTAFCGDDQNPYVFEIKKVLSMVEAHGLAKEAKQMAIKALEETRWIPVSERLPEDLEPVNITWVNHEPEPYYHEIKDKNFVATGIHYRDKWYWYSTTCADYLGEYGSNEIDLVDDAVEIVAWMPLPEAYTGGKEE